MKRSLPSPSWSRKRPLKGIKVKIHYFKVEIVGESLGINDPHQIIEDVGWKSLSDLELIEHVYPEDVEFLENLLKINMEAKPLG
ncbi:hypothetical protein [Mesobacillus subterraneus]|uniref:Uncharacterized protein n=1 Tax=Mesobacillus subterraneus TaxID=285983 RepID=A0A3R9EED6_9BACI|nr:hypothetical protein [Mesobacillus subterraneus]RSD28461.1 hypothetical protein EJA10_05080 [Mesobacillus subterraneus]